MLTFAHRYTYLALLCVGFMLGFYFCLLFSGCGHSASTPAVTRIMPATIQKQATRAQMQFQAKLDSLNTATQHLQAGLQITRAALSKAKQKNNALQRQVYDLLDHPPGSIADTLVPISNGDSLQVAIKDLIVTDSVKDSLYEVVTTNLEQQIGIQDSTLCVQQQRYQSLQSSFTTSLSQQQALQSENTALRKQVKRQKRANIFKAIGLALAGVFATHYLTHP
jgi:hypothetical protein